MSGICQRECDNKTELGYCKTTWCIKPLHLNEILATNLQPTCNKTDLIRRQGAIDAIKKSAMYIPEASTELYMAILAIEELPSAQDWIPCSKKLPKENGRYLVTDFKGDVVTYVFNKEGNSEEYWKRCAKAWMHYPKPYEEATKCD